VGWHLLWERRWRDALIFGLVTLLPFALWQVTLQAHLGQAGVGAGGTLSTSFEVIPFAGVVRILTEGGPSVFVVLSVLLLPFVLLPTLWALAASWRALRRNDS